MVQPLKTVETVREYLLGRVSDETTLEGIEELLFTNEEFCSQVALAEDEIINDYVRGRLDHADAESFRATLPADAERRFKLELAQALKERALARDLKTAEVKSSFFGSIILFFRQPMYAGAFAVLLIAVVVLAVYLTRRGSGDELAELRSIYQQSRPTETRISEFGYAPLTQLRGAPESVEKNRLRHIENSLIEKTEKTPNAQTLHALGVFYVTQHDYQKAISEFEAALKFGNDAKVHNDLGAAHFERAKTAPKEKRLEDLAQSLEEFTNATRLDGNLLEALFNKSLALQELGMAREAKESWTLYLQKDPSSPWAEEARKNLGRLESQQTLIKKDEEVLSDFLTAYRNHDDARAQTIHNETKGLLRGPALPLQLSRRYLIARQRGDQAEAKESLDAMTFIGSFEQAQHSEFFFSELAAYYANVGADKIPGLVAAKDTLASGLSFVRSDQAKAISEFEKSRDLFEQAGSIYEEAIAEGWAAQFLPEIGKIAEGRRRLAALIASARSRKFKVLLPSAYYWLAISDFRQGLFSDSNKNLKTALRLAEAESNIFEIHHAAEGQALNHSRLGELEPALSYASQMLSAKGVYYESLDQTLRDLGTLADLSLRLNFLLTSFSFSRERLSVALENNSDNRRVNDSLRHLVDAATAGSDLTSALAYANDSLQIALKRGDSQENARTVAEIYLLLGDVKSKSRDCINALQDYDQALKLFDRLPEVTDRPYQIHKGKLFCFQQLDRREDFAGELQTVLDLSEQYRATIREDASRQAFFANEQDVFDAAAANAINEGDARRAFDFVERSRARSLLDFIESDKPIAEVEKNFASVSHPLSLTELQARLPEQVQLVQYAVLPEKLAIWVVSKTRFRFVEKPITAVELEKKIEDYQAAVLSKAPAAEVKRAGRELYELLIPSDLADQKLCLVPDKSLHQLAFASLVSPNGKYLLEDFALFYAPSASVLVLATENARQKDRLTTESLLSVGNPDFDRDESPNLADLGSAAAEAKSIAGDYQDSVPLLGGEATKDRFLRDFTAANVIHFAGHFLANRHSPGNSKLLFAGGELRSSELGVYKLPLAKLVVLSACETGFERYDKSEGAIGIARTFLALGAPLVVATQWKVDSEPTKDLMIAFHRNRKANHMTSAESLRQAQLEVLRNGRTQSPYYWAAFSLFGGYANY